MPPASSLPQPLEADDDDVAWALQTAAVEWRRGAFPEAIVWLRRAAESAVQVDQFERAAQINLATNRVSELLASGGSPEVFTSAAPQMTPSQADALLDAVEDDDDERVEVFVQSAVPRPPAAGPQVPRNPPPPADLGDELPRFHDEEGDRSGEDEEYTSPISVPPDIPALIARHRELHPDGSGPAARSGPPAALPPLPAPPARRFPAPPPRPASLAPTGQLPPLPPPPEPAHSRPPRREPEPAPRPVPPPPPPPVRSVPEHHRERSGGHEPPASAVPSGAATRQRSAGSASARARVERSSKVPPAAAPEREPTPESVEALPPPPPPPPGVAEPAPPLPPVAAVELEPVPAPEAMEPAAEAIETAPAAEVRRGGSQPDLRHGPAPALDAALASEEQVAADAIALAAAAVVAEAEALAADAERESIDRMAVGVLEAPSTPAADAGAPAAAAAPAPAVAPAPAPRSEPLAAAAAPESRREPAVLGVSLARAPGLEDLPEESQFALVRSAKLEALGPEEEVSFFAVALVVKGAVGIVAAISGIPCARAKKGEVVFTRGTLESGVALSAIAGAEGAVVAVWDQQALDDATAACPWVADDLRTVADRYQALAGACVGALGERLDDELRMSVFEKCQVRMLLGGDVLFEKGKPVNGMHIVGVGTLELLGDDGNVTSEVPPGEFVFADSVLAAGSAPVTARAGAGGALVVHASRHVTHELMVSVSPLLEILSMA